MLAAIVLEPHALRFCVKHALTLHARMHGTPLTIGSVDGSIFEPLVFQGVRFSTRNAGVVSQVSIERAEARFDWAWRTLVSQRGNGFFSQLTLDGFQGDVVFEPGAADEEPQSLPWRMLSSDAQHGGGWIPIPSRMEVWRARLAVRAGKAGDRTLLLSDTRFTLNEAAPGEVAIGSLEVRRGEFRKGFTGLRGTTAIQGSRLVVADLNLGQGIWLKSVSAELADTAKGQLQMAFDFAAFGGGIRGELLNASRGHRIDVEIAGDFRQIAVADLARFLNAPETAGGTIKEGHFTFRGSPRELDKATATTRFEAVDFVWGKRQWNSLVLGATVVDRRVQIPEFQLQQAHNALKLRGELSLPDGSKRWWETAFNFEIAGRINNLTELSALFGPSFSDTAGVMAIDGSVRGESKTFSGQLIVTGSKLSYRGAPIDVFNAAIKLDGNEFQVVNLEMVHGEDFVRGKGSINILGERRYSGELKVAVDDLAAYAPLLRKPVAPAPFAGGLVLNWSGDGTTAAHSGAFTARLRRLHAIGSNDVFPSLPIDADLEGTYSPGLLSLGKCILANDGTTLALRLAADSRTVKLDSVKLTQGKAVWMEGAAVLPVNLFRFWTAPGVDALVPDAPFKVHLTAQGVQLDDVAHLTGRPVPVSGLVTGKFDTDGTLRTLKMTGAGRLSKGKIPPNPLLPPLSDIEADAELDGNVLRFSKFAARHPVGEFTGIGAIDFSKFESPALDATVHGESIEFSAGPAWKGRAKIDFTIAGTRDHATVLGSAAIHGLDLCPAPDFGPLIKGGSPETINVPPPAFMLPAPLSGWRFDVTAATAAPLELPSPTKGKQARADARLRFSGTGAALGAAGCVTYTGIPFKTGFAAGTVESASFYFGAAGGNGADATVAAKATGKAADVAFTAWFTGRTAKPASVFLSEPEMDESALRSLISLGHTPLPSDIGDLHPDLGIFPGYKEPAAPVPAVSASAAAVVPVSMPAPSPVLTPPVVSSTATPPVVKLGTAASPIPKP